MSQINQVEPLMPKLVIKQDLPEPSIQEKLEGVLRVILPLLLFGIAAIAALSLYVSHDSAVSEVVVQDTPQSGIVLPLAYKQQETLLGDLEHEFEVQEKMALEGYDKHSSLVAKADAILLQLSAMDNVVEGLGLTAENQQEVLASHQYQKDYWEAKRVFHNLRLSRFNASKPESTHTVATSRGGVEAVPDTAPKVELPADLPADFCPLFGPGAAACKPGAGDKKP